MSTDPTTPTTAPTSDEIAQALCLADCGGKDRVGFGTAGRWGRGLVKEWP